MPFWLTTDYGTKDRNYEWTQSEDEVTVSFDLPANIKTRDIHCEIKPTSLIFQIRGQNPIIQVSQTLTFPGEALRLD